MSISPIAFDDVYPQTVIANIGINSANIPYSVFTNDYTGTPAVTTIASFTQPAHGVVTMVTSGATAGRFTYEPTAGYTGGDSFTYTLTNAVGSSVGTVNLTVAAPVIWFVNPTAPVSGTTGTLANPFKTVAEAVAAIGTNTGQRIFLYTGSQSTAVPLKSSGWLVGQGAVGTSFDTVMGITPGSGANARPAINGTRPTIGVSSGTGVTLATGNNVQGLNVTNSNGSGITGSAVGTLTLADFDVTVTGGSALSLTTSGTVTATGADNDLTSTNGTALNVNAVTIGGAGLTFKSISAGAGSNIGIVLENTGGSGGLTVTGTGTTAGSGGTISGKSGGDITSGSAVPLALNGARTGCGVFLLNAASVSLSNMTLQNFSNFGIFGRNVNGFSLTGTTINTTSGFNGDNVGQDEASAGFDGLTGTVAITNCTISNAVEHNMRVTNQSGTIDSLNIKGTTFAQASVPGSPAGGNGLLITMQGTSVLTNASVSGCTFRNNFSNGVLVNTENTSRIGLDNATSSATVGFTMASSTFDDNNIAIQFGQFNSSDLTVDIQGNTIVNDGRRATSGPGSTSHAIIVGSSAIAQAGSTLNARIDGNIIGSSSFAGSGSSIGSGIRAIVQGLTTGKILVNNNTIREAPSGFGMELNFLGPQDDAGTVPVSDITVTNNNVDHRNLPFAPGSSDFPLPAIYLNGDNQGGAAGAPTVRSQVTGNTVPTSGSSFNFLGTWIEVYEYTGSTPGILQLVDVAPGSANATAELTSHNTGTASANAEVSLIAGPITVPPDLTPLPLLFAPAEVANFGLDTPRSAFDAIAWTEKVQDLTDAATVPLNKPAQSFFALLTQADLDALVAVARERWEATGLTGAQLATLRRLEFAVADLPGWYLGEAGGDRIRVDNNAGGNGWFIGATAEDDAQFATKTSATRRYTDPASAPAGRIDLLTALLHEMGHALGLDDTYVATGSRQPDVWLPDQRRAPPAAAARRRRRAGLGRLRSPTRRAKPFPRCAGEPRHAASGQEGEDCLLSHDRTDHGQPAIDLEPGRDQRRQLQQCERGRCGRRQRTNDHLLGIAPTFTSANSTTFTVGTAGNFNVAANGAPGPTFSFTGTLPTGVTLSAAGVLSGTPAAGTGGTYPITITANNGIAPNAMQSFTLTVNQPAAITSVGSTTFTVGTNGNFQLYGLRFPGIVYLYEHRRGLAQRRHAQPRWSAQRDSR